MIINFEQFFVEDVEGKIAAISQMAKLDPKIVEELMLADPTPNKRYINWLVSMYKRNQFVIPEDTGDIMAVVIGFDTYRNNVLFKQKYSGDINSFRTIRELRDAINEFRGVNKTRKSHNDETPGAVDIYNDGTYVITHIQTPEASAIICNNSEWCVRHEETAAEYLKDSDLYLMKKSGFNYALMAVNKNPVLGFLVNKDYKDVENEDLSKNMGMELDPIWKKAGVLPSNAIFGQIEIPQTRETLLLISRYALSVLSSEKGYESKYGNYYPDNQRIFVKSAFNIKSPECMKLFKQNLEDHIEDYDNIGIDMYNWGYFLKKDEQKIDLSIPNANGSYVTTDENGLVHSFNDRPAIRYVEGKNKAETLAWYVHGYVDRISGPALITHIISSVTPDNKAKWFHLGRFVKEFPLYSIEYLHSLEPEDRAAHVENLSDRQVVQMFAGENIRWREVVGNLKELMGYMDNKIPPNITWGILKRFTERDAGDMMDNKSVEYWRDGAERILGDDNLRNGVLMVGRERESSWLQDLEKRLMYQRT